MKKYDYICSSCHVGSSGHHEFDFCEYCGERLVGEINEDYIKEYQAENSDETVSE